MSQTGREAARLHSYVRSSHKQKGEYKPPRLHAVPHAALHAAALAGFLMSYAYDVLLAVDHCPSPHAISPADGTQRQPITAATRTLAPIDASA